MSWAAWVLVICAVVAFACVVAGVVRAAVAGLAVKKHADALKSLPIVAEVTGARVYGERINARLGQMSELLARANGAVQSINASLQEMRIPEAVAAVRTAGAAIRLLFAGR